MLTVIDYKQRVWDGGEWKSVLGLVHILSAELLLHPSLPPRLCSSSAGAPNCTWGDVWVGEVFSQALQLNQGLAWSGALGSPDLSCPEVNPSASSLPWVKPSTILNPLTHWPPMSCVLIQATLHLHSVVAITITSKHSFTNTTQIQKKERLMNNMNRHNSVLLSHLFILVSVVSKHVLL